MNLPMHFISTKDMPRDEIEAILNLALRFEDVARGVTPSRLLEGKVLCTLFYEPSTRTRLSFESAMVRLGGQVLPVADAMRTSSAWKGESIADTVRTIQNYADVIAMRNPVAGAAAEAARYAQIPIINAGDGANEHPTQALLDLPFIWRDSKMFSNFLVSSEGQVLAASVTRCVIIWRSPKRESRLPSAFTKSGAASSRRTPRLAR